MLRATSATTGLPITIGDVMLADVDLGRITSIAPLRGRVDTVRNALGVWPGPNEWIAIDDGRLVWSGLDQALAIGPEISVQGAALTDQSDAWAALRLSGKGVDDVLARLSPVDFRARSFAEGSVARTLVEHMNALVLRDADGFLILAFRSMAVSAVHAVTRAMEQVAAAG